MPNRGMPRLAGGILKRERAVWAGRCAFPGCATGRPVAGIVDFWHGPVGFCPRCCAAAEVQGYSVRYEPIEGVRQVEEPSARCVCCGRDHTDLSEAGGAGLSTIRDGCTWCVDCDLLPVGTADPRRQLHPGQPCPHNHT
jgi:hypothetical protein